jgi:hypothetical protein
MMIHRNDLLVKIPSFRIRRRSFPFCNDSREHKMVFQVDSILSVAQRDHDQVYFATQFALELCLQPIDRYNLLAHLLFD